jgi:hypothetical protein
MGNILDRFRRRLAALFSGLDLSRNLVPQA